ncbi:hypothetical protein HDV06_006574 [Boothiomyces sp. JEL0866]|nr:hypothetical protein HDV06_006574 [Boothiomyces sp. JEL0866]
MKPEYFVLFGLGLSDVLLGTTTPYTASDYTPLGKKLLQAHLVTRHGVRYPTLDNFQAHLDVIQLIQPAFSTPIDLNYGPDSNAGMLHPSGKLSVQQYGERFQARYSTLLADPSTFFTSSSNVPRVLDTASSFFIGMTGNDLPNGAVQDRTLDADNDMNKSCLKYTNSPKNKKESSIFEKKYLPQLADKLNTKLQMNLTAVQASNLIDACAFQIAFGALKQNESFCALFDSDDFKNYQLDDDFQKYYSLSYGLDPPLNSQLACSLLTDISNNINNQSLAASFHFGHAETIIPLLTSLGLFKDSGPLTNTEPKDQLSNRKFKTGIMAPMQSNIVFEIYENNDIRLVLNEAPIDIPGCSDSAGLCSFTTFQHLDEFSGAVMIGNLEDVLIETENDQTKISGIQSVNTKLDDTVEIPKCLICNTIADIYGEDADVVFGDIKKGFFDQANEMSLDELLEPVETFARVFLKFDQCSLECDNCRDKTLVALIGKTYLMFNNSGSGKSVVANILYGSEPTIVHGGRSFGVDFEESIFRSSSSNQSVTIFPQFEILGVYLLADFPGFGDTRTNLLELLHYHFISKVFKNRSCKFIFLEKAGDDRTGPQDKIMQQPQFQSNSTLVATCVGRAHLDRYEKENLTLPIITMPHADYAPQADPNYSEFQGRVFNTLAKLTESKLEYQWQLSDGAEKFLTSANALLKGLIDQRLALVCAKFKETRFQPYMIDHIKTVLSKPILLGDLIAELRFILNDDLGKVGLELDRLCLFWNSFVDLVSDPEANPKMKILVHWSESCVKDHNVLMERLNKAKIPSIAFPEQPLVQDLIFWNATVNASYLEFANCQNRALQLVTFARPHDYKELKLLVDWRQKKADQLKTEYERILNRISLIMAENEPSKKNKEDKAFIQNFGLMDAIQIFRTLYGNEWIREYAKCGLEYMFSLGSGMLAGEAVTTAAVPAAAGLALPITLVAGGVVLAAGAYSFLNWYNFQAASRDIGKFNFKVFPIIDELFVWKKVLEQQKNAQKVQELLTYFRSGVLDSVEKTLNDSKNILTNNQLANLSSYKQLFEIVHSSAYNLKRRLALEDLKGEDCASTHHRWGAIAMARSANCCSRSTWITSEKIERCIDCKYECHPEMKCISAAQFTECLAIIGENCKAYKPEITDKELNTLWTENTFKTPTFVFDDTKLEYSCAQLSDIVYYDHVALPDTELYTHTNGVQFLVHQSEKHLLVAIRGSYNVQNWITNLDIEMITVENAKVHSGFYTVGLELYERLCKILAIHSQKKVVFTGHSLGGAIAKILQFIHFEREHKMTKAITFGAPQPFAELNTEYDILSICNSNDFVPALTIQLGYKPFGKFVFLPQPLVITDESIVQERLQNVINSAKSGVINSLVQVPEHLMQTYMAQLKSSSLRLNISADPDMLGYGAFGIVRRQIVDGKIRAVKWLVSNASAEEVQKEAQALNQMKHPYIVQIYAIANDGPKRIGLVMEIMEGGSLSAHIHSSNFQNDEPTKLRWTYQIASGLEYIHSKMHVHCDLKPENVLLTGDYRIAKISDFGLAKLKPEGNKTSIGNPSGTPNYFAPELFNGERNSFASDIYALGLILYEIYTLKVVVVAHLQCTVCEHVSKDLEDSAVAKAIKKCLIHEKEYRPSSKTMVKMIQKSPLFSTVFSNDAVQDTESSAPTTDKNTNELLATVINQVSLESASEPEDNPQFKLGLEFFEKQQYNDAFNVFKESAAVDHVGSKYKLAWMYHNGLGVDVDLGTALELYREAAEKGQHDAMGQLGLFFLDGIAVQKDRTQALFWLEKGLCGNSQYSYYGLGLLYSEEGENQDMAKAEEFLNKAADQGNVPALNLLMEQFNNDLVHDNPEFVALEWYTKAASQGDATAQFNLGNMYKIGRGIPQDYEKAMVWFRKAADQGHSEAQCTVGYFYRNGYGVGKDFNTAVEWYLKSAAQGQATAQYNLGLVYKNGEGVAQDYSVSMEWFQKAADQGYPAAQNSIGLYYNDGIAVSKDINKAIEWYSKSASKWYVVAQYNLGLIYDRGEGVKSDYEIAMSWYQKAASQGYPDAQLKIGNLYYFGRGVPKDINTALVWYTKAAATGHPDAEYYLGLAYKKGEGVPHDYVKAMEWFKKAAIQNLPCAQSTVGYLYRNGLGIDKDINTAIEWYSKAASNGYAIAQYNLALMYKNGEGVAQDCSISMEWLGKSAAQGYTSSMLLIGAMYCNGTGVDQDFQKALEWYRKAASKGSADAEFNIGVMYNTRQAIKNLRLAVHWYRKAAAKGHAKAQNNLGRIFASGELNETKSTMIDDTIKQ